MTSVRRLPLIVATLAIVVSAWRFEPAVFGDGLEYFLMAESLFNHASPNLQPEDLLAFARASSKHDTPLPAALGWAYFKTDGGTWYCYHFWAYSLSVLPMKWALRLFDLNELKALQLTNALWVLVVLLKLWRMRRWSIRQRALFALLLVVSPFWWYLFWPHPEIFSAALVALALLSMDEGSPRAAVGLAALAALQNPPIVLFVAFLVVRALVRTRLSREGRGWLVGLEVVDARGVLGRLVPASIALLYPLFYTWHFGVPSLVAKWGTSPELMSIGRAGELLFDLNIGLLPYVPVALMAAGAAGLAEVRRGRVGDALSTPGS